MHFSACSIRTEYKRHPRESRDKTKSEKLKHFYKRISKKAWQFFEEKNSSRAANVCKSILKEKMNNSILIYRFFIGSP